MSLTEKTAYLKGLYDGLGLSAEESKEARMLGTIVDVLQEMAEHVEENEDSIAVLDDQVCDLTEAMDDDDFDFDDDDDEEEYERLYALEDKGEDEEDEEEEVELELPVEIACPACGEQLSIGAEELEAGQVTCPGCGKELEIEIDVTEDDDDDDDPSDDDGDMPF